MKKYTKQDLIRLVEWLDIYNGGSYLSYDIVEEFIKDLEQNNPDISKNHISSIPLDKRPKGKEIIPFSTGFEQMPLEIQKGVYRDKLEISSNMLPNIGKNSIVLYNIRRNGKDYWAKTGQEIDFIKKFEKIYAIAYVPGLFHPIDNNNFLSTTAKDGYELHIIGKLKKEFL